MGRNAHINGTLFLMVRCTEILALNSEVAAMLSYYLDLGVSCCSGFQVLAKHSAYIIVFLVRYSTYLIVS